MKKKTDQACFLPLQLLMMLSDVLGIRMTKLVTKSDRVAKLHGIIKSLLLTATPLDYFNFLLIQKQQSVSELIKRACFFLKILKQQFMKKHIPHL